MSGVICAASVMAAAPVPPLTCSTNLNTGTTAFDVSGASGNFYTQLTLVFTSNISGGVPPYPTGTLSLVQEGTVGSGLATTSLGLAPGDVQNHQTIFWSNMAFGDYLTVHGHIDCSDSAGSTASADSPTYVIHRTI